MKSTFHCLFNFINLFLFVHLFTYSSIINTENAIFCSFNLLYLFEIYNIKQDILTVKIHFSFKYFSSLAIKNMFNIAYRE
jgi:hypothetical protein